MSKKPYLPILVHDIYILVAPRVILFPISTRRYPSLLRESASYPGETDTPLSTG
jgi:hypothetical protein